MLTLLAVGIAGRREPNGVACKVISWVFVLLEAFNMLYTRVGDACSDNLHRESETDTNLFHGDHSRLKLVVVISEDSD